MSWANHEVTVKIVPPEPWVQIGTYVMAALTLWLLSLSALTIKMLVTG